MLEQGNASESIGVATSRESAVLSFPSRLQVVLWIILFLSNIIDVASSWYVFSLGCEELNPVIALVYERWGINGLTLFKSFCLFVLLVLLPHVNGWKLTLFMLCCSIYAGLAIYHIAQLLRTTL